MQPTEALHTTPAHRAIIKLFIVLALLAALAAIVTMSGTVGYVAFGLALVVGIAGMWLFVGPRKRATPPGACRLDGITPLLLRTCLPRRRATN